MMYDALIIEVPCVGEGFVYLLVSYPPLSYIPMLSFEVPKKNLNGNISACLHKIPFSFPTNYE